MELNSLNKMKLEEIKIGKIGIGNIESTRNAILENLGKQVILSDVHEGLLHGRLLNRIGERSYNIFIADKREETTLWYVNLKKLVLLKGYGRHTLPEIKTK